MAHTPVETVHIHLGDRSYPILIGAGLLSAASTWADMPKGSSALIVTNTTVAPLYGSTVQAALAPHFAKVHVLGLPVATRCCSALFSRLWEPASSIKVAQTKRAREVQGQAQAAPPGGVEALEPRG